MGIWDRLGSVIKSYLSDDETAAGKTSTWRTQGQRGDPDLDAAYDELDDYLDGKRKGKENREEPSGYQSGKKQKAHPAPARLHKDFEMLGLGPEAGAEECKEAYKKLLKKYHPDRHAQTPENLKKATGKTAEINAAYDRLEEWFKASS